MATFAKLSSNLITSSLWATETAEAKVLWITLLALKDRDGIVEATVPGLARLAGITLEECEAALGRFCEPDPYSRTKEHEGRRLEPVEGGWQLLNHAKYRGKTSAERSAAWRAEQKAKKDAEQAERSRALASAQDTARTHTDTDTDTDSLSPTHSRQCSKHWTSDKFQAVWHEWLEHCMIARGQCVSEPAEKQQLYDLERFDTADAVAVVRFSIGRQARQLITNGDHKRPADNGGRGRRRDPVELEI